MYQLHTLLNTSAGAGCPGKGSVTGLPSSGLAQAHPHDSQAASQKDRQRQRLQKCLRALELAQFHFCFNLWAKSSHKASPGPRKLLSFPMGTVATSYQRGCGFREGQRNRAILRAAYSLQPRSPFRHVHTARRLSLLLPYQLPFAHLR